MILVPCMLGSPLCDARHGQARYKGGFDAPAGRGSLKRSAKSALSGRRRSFVVLLQGLKAQCFLLDHLFEFIGIVHDPLLA